MKWAVCSLSNRETMRALSWPLMEKYCKRHGYDFVTKTEPYTEDRHPSWCKLLLMKELLPKYDVVVWFDDDIILTQPDLKLEDLLRSFLVSERLLAVSKNITNPFNFGLIVAKKTAGKILDQIWNNVDEETRFGLFWEESAAAKLFVSDQSFNDKIYIFLPGVIQGFHSANNASPELRWNIRTFALHVSGFPDVNSRIEHMEEAIKELNLIERFSI